ncbi:MAG: GDSL-type esterase/lipase family protein [bacterium]
MSCSTTKVAKRLPPPPAGFVPMEADNPGKEKISDFTKKRMEQFTQEDITKLQGGIVFLGDSITHRFPVEKYFPNLKVINRGIGGDTMGGIRHYGVYNRLESTVYNLHPKMIILMIAFNDLAYSAGTPFELKLAQYEYLVWKIRHDLPKTELWCVSVLPAREGFASKNETIQKFNEQGRKVAEKYGAKWIDAYPYFLDETGVLKKEFAIDSVHPSPAGYEVLANIYKHQIFKTK